MLKPMRDKNEGARTGGGRGGRGGAGGEGKTPVTTRRVQRVVEGKTSEGLSWRVNVIIYKKRKRYTSPFSPADLGR